MTDTQVPRSAPYDLVFVSDLHLTVTERPGAPSGTPSRGPHHARAFETLVRNLIDSHARAGRPWSLVVLGDCLDFVDIAERAASDPEWTSLDGDARAARALERILAENSAVVAALRACLSNGVSVHFVVGNHDMDLCRPGVQRRLRELLGGSDGSQSSLTFHSWFLRVPDLVFAEHGHQHHAVNRFPAVLTPTEPGPRRLSYRPVSAVLGQYHHSRARSPASSPAGRAAGTARMLAAVVAVLVDHSSPRRVVQRGRQRTRLFPDFGARHALSVHCVDDLDRCSSSIYPALVRTVWRRTRSRITGAPLPDYMAEAGARVHRVLRRHGCAAPFYVFGHTHSAADRPVVRGARARYLNTGTWSPSVRGGLGLEPGGGSLTYVVVRQDAGRGRSGEVRRWPELGTCDLRDGDLAAPTSQHAAGRPASDPPDT